ncbi:MAG TPA: hypothetical protein VNJ03_00380 [Vicinamibacterales bacterium]|nr:hypothetical protein [Vicinamibacterales bacterium]
MRSHRVSWLLRDALRHPVTHFVRHWNWKAALISSVCRATIFFVMNVPAGMEAGVRALVTELLFRAVASGVLGSLTQTLRHARPAWHGAVAALLIMPAVGHAAEYAVHRLAGTPRLSHSMFVSVAFTCFTTTFNLFAMRRGALIVGAGQRSLAHDLRAMPRLIAEFVTCGYFHENPAPHQRVSRAVGRHPHDVPGAPRTGRTGRAADGARRASGA